MLFASLLLVSLLLSGLLTGCRAPEFLDTGPCEESFAGAAMATCPVPGHDDRDYDVVLPTGYDGATSTALPAGGVAGATSTTRAACIVTPRQTATRW